MTLPTATPFTPKQLLILIVLGVVFWFLAAMLVGTIGPMGALSGRARWITYVLVIPGTIPAILISRRLASLTRSQTSTGLLVVTAAALLLDGIAHAWFPSLYGSDPQLLLAGAAVIFWGAGVGLILAFIMSRESQS
jgi:hypothetical protein